MTINDAKEIARGVLVPLVVAVLVSGGSSWLGVQIAMTELEARMDALEVKERERVEREREDKRRDSEFRDILIRVDERTGATDRRLQRLERILDGVRGKP